MWRARPLCKHIQAEARQVAPNLWAIRFWEEDQDVWLTQSYSKPFEEILL